MKLNWMMVGERFTRVYTAQGQRGTYRIDLDQPPIDRWVLHINGRRCVENFYYVPNAKRIASLYEESGGIVIPEGMRYKDVVEDPSLVHSPDTGEKRSPTLPPGLGQASVLSRPHAEMVEVADSFHRLVVSFGIQPEPTGTPWLPWKSGVYALLDCVFSARAKYEAVVLPMLTQRLPRRPGLVDCERLAFSAFLADVETFGPDAIERYGEEVLTRHMIGGRRKVAVCCDAARFFVAHRMDTIGEIRALPPDRLENLVLEDLQASVRGIGPALASYLLILFGDERHIKLDVMLHRFLKRVAVDLGRAIPMEYDFVRTVFARVADRLGTTPARLDNAIWRFESEGEA